MQKLTAYEFHEKDFPMFYVELSSINKEDDEFYAKMMEKYISSNIKSWWFRYDNSYIFWVGDQEFAQQLINWLEETPFNKSHGTM